MSCVVEVGHIIRAHDRDEVRELGRVVWVDPSLKPTCFCYIEYPETQSLTDQKRRTRAFIRAHIRGSIERLQEEIANLSITLVKETHSSELLLTDSELGGDNDQVGLNRPTRRILKKWKDRRDEDLKLIQPILKKYTAHELFGDDLLSEAARKHAKHLKAKAAKRKSLSEGETDVATTSTDQPDPESGKPKGKREVPSAAEIEQVLRRYFLRGAIPNALLPRYFNSGGEGQIKFCKAKTGRPNMLRSRTLIRTATVLKMLQTGYTRFKKKGVSDEQAFDMTLGAMWAASITYVGPGKAEVTLVPEDQRPTLGQFLRAKKLLGLQAKSDRFKLGDVAFASKFRDRRGTARDGIHAVGQVGVLDATSEDHSPVSMSSRLLVLPTAWRTMIADALTEYIFGVHRGFEHGGTSAGLSALYHAERDKLEWADSLGIHLKKGDWLSIGFQTVRGDHGDLKSEGGIKTLSSSEMSLEITRSYMPQLKMIEIMHLKMQANSDHHLPNTNHGELRGRGQSKPDEYINFLEGWPPLVRQIHFHNNVEPVPHLLTLEMRRAKVAPTRRAIVEFCIAEGYLSSQPTNLDVLRAACLPPIAAQGHAEEIEVWDPRVPVGRRKVPAMRYFGDFMNSPEWKLRPRRDIEIKMNTSRVGEAFINMGGIQRLKLLHTDLERHDLTFADWLAISDVDRLALFLADGKVREARASQHHSNQLGFDAAKAERDKQRAAGGVMAKPTATSKRKALDAERPLMAQQAMGLAPPIPHQVASPAPALTVKGPARQLPPVEEEDDAWMAHLRQEGAK